jgi:hypothetical protein
LIQIVLNENKITKLDTIKSLAELANLEEIELTGNPITETTNYKDFVFEK